jgi:FkbM family methyltransferase
MIGRILYEMTFEAKRCRLSRLIHHPRVARMLHRRPPEPEVHKCLVETDWKGPVWDVGAFVGNHAYDIAQRHDLYAFEPNLCILYYLGYKLKDCPRVTLVPCALTPDGQPMKGSIEPNFTKPATGPRVATLSVTEALQKFGRPGLIKLDIEGGEYELIKSPSLTGLTLLVEWHREVPTQMDRWNVKALDHMHTLLTPK